ncbi:MAG: hypothetical protein J6C19_02400 [Lachnospiraceae bacterium]|nr:hypothetical protein [Lachnospiraceae bacterium]MBO5144370.1 hypothetical protein [Lachnospiraceae bacterium]
MNEEKNKVIERVAESFTKKTEIEKAFILGYMVKISQEKEKNQGERVPELVEQ